MKVKIYVVQQADEHGNLKPDIVACKLRFEDAHKIARDLAPAKVTPLVADKTPDRNGSPDSSRGGSSHGAHRHQPH